MEMHCHIRCLFLRAMPSAIRHSDSLRLVTRTKLEATQDRVHVTLEVESTLSQRYLKMHTRKVRPMMA